MRDFQCYGIHGVDPSQGMVTWGGPWNIMNGIAGHPQPAGDLRVGRHLRVQGQGARPRLGRPDDRVDHRLRPVEPRLRVQLPGGPRVVLGRGAAGRVHDPRARCSFGRGARIQYRAYTLTLWSGVVLTFPHFMHDSMFAHRSAHNPWALLILSAAALVANVWVFAAHVRSRSSPSGATRFTQEVHADEATYASWVRDLASDEDKELIAARLGATPAGGGVRRCGSADRFPLWEPFCGMVLTVLRGGSLAVVCARWHRDDSLTHGNPLSGALTPWSHVNPLFRTWAASPRSR